MAGEIDEFERMYQKFVEELPKDIAGSRTAQLGTKIRDLCNEVGRILAELDRQDLFE